MQDIHNNSLDGVGGGGITAERFFGVGDRRLRAFQSHHNHNHHHRHNQALKCPRCSSLNTKFCYYNNYNLSQPRYFCKSCRRYWTKGGVLRNVPVGGGCRKTKRTKSKHCSSEPVAGKSPTEDDRKEKSCTASLSNSDSSSHTVSNSGSDPAVGNGVWKGSASVTEVASVPVSYFCNSPKLYGNGIEWSEWLGQGSLDCGSFAEMGSFTSMISASTDNDTTPFGFAVNSTLGCFDHMNGQQIDDQMAQVQLAEGSSDPIGEFGPLDWRGETGEDQTLLDLTSTVDHAYWSQGQWTTDQNQNGLYLP